MKRLTSRKNTIDKNQRDVSPLIFIIHSRQTCQRIGEAVVNRRQARVKAIQALFQIDMSKTDVAEAVAYVLDTDAPDEFLERIVAGTIEHIETIDRMIANHLQNWSLQRIGNVDRAILRLAVYELTYEKNIPTNVTLNEAIELAKLFGGEESSRFINGVLSKIVEGEQ